MNDYGFLDKAIALRPDFLELVDGDHTVAIMLSQAVYWQLRVGEGEDWYKSYDDWDDECWLSPDQIRRCRGILREFDFWSEDTRGMPQRIYYHVDLARLAQAIRDLHPTPRSRDGETPDQGMEKPQTKGSGNPTSNPSYNKETTPESTTEKSAPDPSPPRNGSGDDPGGRVQQLAETHELGTDRDNLPADERMELTEIEQKFSNDLGQPWSAAMGKWVERMQVISARFTEAELDEAIEACVDRGAEDSWPFLRGCLNNADGDGGGQDADPTEEFDSPYVQ